jgi:hypothetical protein
MVCRLWLVLIFGLRIVGKLSHLLSFIIRLLSVTFMIQSIRLGRVLFFAFVFQALGLVKLLLMLNLPLPILMMEVNDGD